MKDRRKKIAGMKENHYGGVRIQMMNSVMIVAVVVVSVVLLVSIDLLKDTYQELKTTTDMYISCQEDARDIMVASDYLTDQVRTFAVTGEIKYMQNYFAESREAKTRDKALNNMKGYLPESAALPYLELAVDESVKLMDTEYHAMGLVASAQELDPEELPEEVRDVKLSEEEKELSDREKMAKARALVFDADYQQEKDAITMNVRECLEELQHQMEGSGDSNFHEMEENMHRVSFLIGAMMFLFLLMIALIMKLVVQPLQKNVDFLNQKTHLPMKGAFELQYLAYVYNRMYDENKEQSDRLAYEAVHDGLTGAYNRAGFEEKLQGADPQTVTLVLIDIDRFKEINDSYGHGVGDLVLKRLVKLFHDYFRQEDYICRIGGDEFAIIMLFTDSTAKDVILKKFEVIRNQLKQPSEGMPPISLSVGVAFCDRSNPTESMFKDADVALYVVKRGGKNGVHFYGDDQTPSSV